MVAPQQSHYVQAYKFTNNFDNSKQVCKLHQKKKNESNKNFNQMPLITAVINNKGGVGKTTTAINLAAGLTLLKQKVLVLDLDPQGNVATSIGLEPYDKDKMPYTMGDIFANPTMKLNSAIVKTKYFDLIGNNMLTYTKTQKSSTPKKLKDILDKANLNYDHIIIDTPPSIEFYTSNAIVASDILLIVSEFSKFSMVGVKVLLSVLEEWPDKDVAASMKNKPKPVLFTLYDKRTTLTKTLESQIEKQSPTGLILETKIPRTVKVQENIFEGVPTVGRANNPASAAYKELAETWYFAGKTKVLAGKNYRINLPIK